MHAHAFGRHIAERVVERLDMARGAREIGSVVGALVHHMASEAEIWAINLKHKTRRDDRFVFGTHGFRERFQIGVVAWIMFIRVEKRDNAGRSGIHEGAGGHVGLASGS